MRGIARLLATAAVLAAMGGQTFAQTVVTVGDAPIHKIDPDPASPAAKPKPTEPKLSEPRPVPNTLNAQMARLDDLKVVRASDPPPPPPPTSSPAAEPEGPTAAFAPSLIDAAGAFGAYVAKAGAIDAKFVDGAAIGKAVTTSASYETVQFQEGMVAYAALVALQEPGFVQGVYDLGRDERDAGDLAAQLLADPRAVLAIDGADEAAATVTGVLGQMGADLVKAGQGARKAAYDVQSQAWSKEAAPDPQARLAEAKKISTARSAMTEEDTSALMTSLLAMRKTGASVGGRAPAPTPMVARGLALAALAVLGRAGEEEVQTLAPLLTDAKSEDCMKMAKLNLYQCLAVAGPHYEHAFCLGQHALADTGQCVISAAGQSPIPQPTLVAAPVKKSRSIAVPMALVSPAGPERSLAYARPAARAAEAAEAPAREEAPAAPREMAVAAPPPAREERLARDDRDEAPRQGARRDERYDEEQEQEQDDAPPQRPVRQAQRDDRYDPYGAPYGRDPREFRQDYDPYAGPYGRYPPPGYGYGYGR